MGLYRETRNVEASILDFIEEKLSEYDWDVRIVKTFNQAYKEKMPVICIRCSDNVPTSCEIGSHELMNYYSVLIDIFAFDDGLKLDLSDWLINTVKNGFPYYEYTISKNVQGHYEVANKVQNGKLELLRFTSDRNLEFGENADAYDKHRRLISFIVYIQN